MNKEARTCWADVLWGPAVLMLILIFTSCSSSSNGEQHPNSESDLHSFVNKTVTLHGRYVVEGKMGPYIHTTAGSVYLLKEISGPTPRDSSFEGENVRVTGTLRFQHFDRPATTEPVDLPPDYFYFDAATAKIMRE